AKISYQYPKGTFRFPLIPDEVKPLANSPVKNESKEKEPMKNRKRETKTPEGQSRGNTSKHIPEERDKNVLRRDYSAQSHQVKVSVNKRQESIPQKKELNPPQLVSNPKNIDKKEIKRHGPFRPTIIPSPIYGY